MAFDLQFTSDESAALVPGLFAGTPVLTPDGPKRAEDLNAGDEVTTSSGEVALLRLVLMTRWAIDRHTAPVVITDQVLGHHDQLVVSPQTRIVIAHPQAELLYGSAMVMVPAMHLPRSIAHRGSTGESMVTYVQLICDAREVLIAGGLPFECTTVDQINMPDLFGNHVPAISPMPVLDADETAILMKQMGKS